MAAMAGDSRSPSPTSTLRRLVHEEEQNTLEAGYKKAGYKNKSLIRMFPQEPRHAICPLNFKIKIVTILTLH